jgi:hypothetical protein
MPSPNSGTNAEGIRHALVEKRLPDRRDRCSRLMSAAAATTAMLIFGINPSSDLPPEPVQIVLQNGQTQGDRSLGPGRTAARCHQNAKSMCDALQPQFRIEGKTAAKAPYPPYGAK